METRTENGLRLAVYSFDGEGRTSMSQERQAPLSIPTGGPGEPTLLVGTTGGYNLQWIDRGGGARQDVTVFRRVPTDTTYFIIGDYAQGDYQDPTGSSVTVKAVNDSGGTLLQPPVGWTQIWNDHGSRSQDGSFWAAIPPDGYIALGFIAEWGYDTPNIPNYRCLRLDLVEVTPVGNEIWSDSGSGANEDITLYSVQGLSNAFVAQGDYNPFSGSCYRIRGAGA